MVWDWLVWVGDNVQCQWGHWGLRGPRARDEWINHRFAWLMLTVTARRCNCLYIGECVSLFYVGVQQKFVPRMDEIGKQDSNPGPLHLIVHSHSLLPLRTSLLGAPRKTVTNMFWMHLSQKIFQIMELYFFWFKDSGSASAKYKGFVQESNPIQLVSFNFQRRKLFFQLNNMILFWLFPAGYFVDFFFFLQ